jgi:molecular chaperone DnaJ
MFAGIKMRNSSSFGNQYVHFNIKVPTYVFPPANCRFNFQFRTLLLFFLSQTKQTDNLKNLPVCREVTKRQQELIEEFDKEECSDKERIAAASG